VDYETINTYTLTLEVTDSGSPMLGDTETITINILNVAENTAPSFTAAGPYSLSEDAAVSAVVGTVLISDAEGDGITYEIMAGNVGNIFSIDSAGLITVANASLLDYESATSHTLSIRITDNGFGALSNLQSFVIQILDVNDTFSSASFESPLSAVMTEMVERPQQIMPISNPFDIQQRTSLNEQILRDNLTILIDEMVEENIEDNMRIENFLSADSSISEIQPEFVSDSSETKSDYTNLREAIFFLQSMEDQQSNEKVENEETDKGPLPLKGLDPRFVDVMIYHQERAEKLRAALMGAAA
jgi:hypothetical protein